jgi:hypothetical protein
LKSVGWYFPLVLDEMDQYLPTYILSINYETINKNICIQDQTNEMKKKINKYMLTETTMKNSERQAIDKQRKETIVA